MLVVHQCAGDLRYLKVQFQHWSIEITQLYAQHDLRDQDLVDEMVEAMLEYKSALVASWLNAETRLGGRGGAHIVNQRGRPTFAAILKASKGDLIQSLAPGIIIRPTGHGWCLSGGELTCGGSGLYDALFCADCDSAVIGETHASIWELTAMQLVEAQSLGDLGPAAEQKLRRSLECIAEEILKPLGSSLEIAKANYDVGAQ